jgi:16S rRNA G966 N2-methylase RsmD
MPFYGEGKGGNMETKSIALLSNAARMLAEVKTIDDAKQLMDMAAAAKVYAQKHKLGKEAVEYAQEIERAAFIKLGEILADMEKNKGGNPELQPLNHDEELRQPVLKDLGISYNLSSESQAIASLPEYEKEKFKKGKTSKKKVVSEVRKKKQEQKRQEIAEQNKNKSIPENIKLIHGDFYTTNMLDNSIDLILTDPPYPAEFLPLWDKLGEFANRVLKPSGYLVAYSGQLHLNEVFASLNKHLLYYWTFALIHSGNHQLIMPRNIFCGWKPLLVFQKAPFKKLENKLDDVIQGSGREKDLHNWAQAEGELDYIIQNFTLPGEIILDPFAGSGTTLIAALKNKRKAIGIEIDETNVNIIKGRISDVEQRV